ncbi:MAG: glutathione peroxidase [Bacteriovoracaceae bacterium]|nr:glutathione peroxidase [Bacteriovoracaceae bacterium]
MTIYDHTFKNAQNEEVAMSNYKDKVLLIVNTASKCGFTKQYDGLEKLYENYQSEGLEVLGFPCNQFGGQEPGSDSEIQEFCKLSFGVKFPVYGKIDVNGKNAHPLYEHLKEQAPGILGSKSIKWNFTKFLVDRDGTVLKRFSPKDTPAKIEKDIKRILSK